MLLKKLLWSVVIISTCLANGCTSNIGDLKKSNEITASSTWLLLSPNEKLDTYYDPYQTVRDGYGNVESLVWSRSKSQNYTVSKLNINCDKKIYRYSTITSTGQWELASDWIAPDPQIAQMGWIMGLCGRKSPEGEQLEFVNWSKLNSNSDLFYAHYWYKDKEYSPSVKGGKTFKVFYHRPTEKTSYYTYFYSDCVNKKYAINSELKLKDLKWESGAAPNSGAAVLFYYACRTKLSALPTKPPTVAEGIGSNDLNEAKSKCADLGFKKGTEQFGNCVLKLTK